ncbi:hypothetical protein D3C84_1146290 [compost metagenome]
MLEQRIFELAAKFDLAVLVSEADQVVAKRGLQQALTYVSTGLLQRSKLPHRVLGILGNVEHAGIALVGFIGADQQYAMNRDAEQAEAPAVKLVFAVARRAFVVA